jgi:hypothetical protein
VQGILEAAQATAAEIEREAVEDARHTRDEAVRRAQEHVQAVARATATLLQRVEAMDGELRALLESLRAGAGRLVADLGSVEASMGEVYDTAGRPPASAQAAELGGVEPVAQTTPPTPPAVPASRAEEAQVTAPVSAPHTEEAASTAPVPVLAPAGSAGAGGEDLDGARLVALNMALNGEPREHTDRYLADSFQLADREKLLDEVYAAIEG